MFETIKDILKQYTEADESAITEEANLQNDLALNSLDLMNIIVEFEEQFGIQIADEDVGNLVTVKDIEKYLNEKTASVNG